VKDLAGIGRLAADGIANARHASENHQLRTQVIPQYEQQVGSCSSQLDAQIALNREILTDEGRYARAVRSSRAEFTRAASFPRGAARSRIVIVAKWNRSRASSTSPTTRRTSSPSVSVFTEAPTVTNEEVMGRISLETQHLLQNGVVPPENYPKFVDYLTKTLAPWASGLHAQRSQTEATRQARRTSGRDSTRTAQARSQHRRGPLAHAGGRQRPRRRWAAHRLHNHRHATAPKRAARSSSWRRRWRRNALAHRNDCLEAQGRPSREGGGSIMAFTPVYISDTEMQGNIKNVYTGFRTKLYPISTPTFAQIDKEGPGGLKPREVGRHRHLWRRGAERPGRMVRVERRQPAGFVDHDGEAVHVRHQAPVHHEGDRRPRAAGHAASSPPSSTSRRRSWTSWTPARSS
jgi:hypothetical protein